MVAREMGRPGKSRAAKLLAGGVAVAFTVSAAGAQTISSVPDAQVEANVLKALAAAPELSTQDIQSSTVYGVVTLSGSVQTETMRSRAENLVARASGVKKVVDELTLGSGMESATSSQASVGGTEPDNSQQPVLQSDGSYAPAPPAEPAAPYNGPVPANSGENGSQTAQNGTPQPYGQTSAPGYDQPAPGYRQPSSNQPVPYAQTPYPQPTPYPQQPYGQGNQSYGYAQQPGYAPQGGQQAGLLVTVPSGSLLRVRINRGLDSNHIATGTPFDGTVLSDVIAGGAVAIPRGAQVQGVVVDAKRAGALKGEGELALQINNVVLGGKSFPLVSGVWERQGRDKTVGTVNSALGLGVLGAIVGGVAGGGAGAAVGAGVGAGVGVAGSAASPGGRVIVPPEAVLNFTIAEPSPVRTVSEQEMQRLAYAAGPGQGSSVRPVVRRRYYAPYYPYGPAPYGYRY